MEFSIQLGGWVHLKKIVLKHFNLPKMHFKANLFFPTMTPLTHPTTHPRDYWGGDTRFLESQTQLKPLTIEKYDIPQSILWAYWKMFLFSIFNPPYIAKNHPTSFKKA